MHLGLGKFTSRLMSLGLICLVLFGCVRAADAITKRKTSAVARLDQPFTLRAGQQIALQGQKLRVRFEEVTQDSRCPVDVTCVWAGNAAVRLEVTANVSYGTNEGDISPRSKKRLTLNTAKSPTLVSEAEYEGFKVKLVDLSPVRHSNRKIAPGDYVATLIVNKK